MIRYSNKIIFPSHIQFTGKGPIILGSQSQSLDSVLRILDLIEACLVPVSCQYLASILPVLLLQRPLEECFTKAVVGVGRKGYWDTQFDISQGDACFSIIQSGPPGPTCRPANPTPESPNSLALSSILLQGNRVGSVGKG